jgi:hypothetical protein
MIKDNDYYRKLDLPRLAKEIPRDKQGRGRAEAFHEMLLALALRYPSERFTETDLRALLGEPDSVKPVEGGEAWEYSWVGEHCSHEYRSATHFLIKEGFVTGIHRKELTPTS